MRSLLLVALLLLPASLEPVDARKQEFLEKCYKYQSPKRCDQVAASVKITIVDDFVFRTGASHTGLASGLTSNGRAVKVAYYNRIATDDLALCAQSPLVRTRLEMHKLSGRNRYWLTAPFEYRCADPNDLLPALVHEMCHAFGANVGHITGLDECQARKK